jgi:hypothetical protein
VILEQRDPRISKALTGRAREKLKSIRIKTGQYLKDFLPIYKVMKTPKLLLRIGQ